MRSQEDPTIGEVVGLKALDVVRAVEINEWYDCGSVKYLEKAKHLFKNDDHNILEKEAESIWFQDDYVVKFSTDKTFIRDRVERVRTCRKILFLK